MESSPGEVSLRSTEPNSCFDGSQLPMDNDFICTSLGGSHFFEMDDYPGCLFNISYAYTKCTNMFTGVKFFYVERITLESHNCQEYNDDVMLASQNGNLDAFSVAFDAEVIKAATDHIGSQNVGSFGAVVVVFETASCVRYCYVPVIGKDGTNFSSLVFNRKNCGTACCKISSTYWYSGSCECVDSYTENLTEDNVECIGNADPGCSSHAAYTTDCTYRCDHLLN